MYFSCLVVQAYTVSCGSMNRARKSRSSVVSIFISYVFFLWSCSRISTFC